MEGRLFIRRPNHDTNRDHRHHRYLDSAAFRANVSELVLSVSFSGYRLTFKAPSPP